MKQLLLVILSICLIPITGCQSNILLEAPAEIQTPMLEETWRETTEAQQVTEPEETTSETEERRDTEFPTQIVSPEPATTPTEDIAKNDNQEPEMTATEPSATTSSPLSTENATQPEDTVEPTSLPSDETKPLTTEPSEPEAPKATAADVSAIAAKLVECLNAYRMEQGSSQATVLPGLTQYAEYRSRQLVSNFAHDTFDERAAATALEYGSYIDPAVYGMTGDPYYAANAREAIAKTDFGGSIDAVAARLARMVRNSSSHWNYVGSSGYTYIGVGITYNGGVWYCDIAVTDSNTDTQ